MEFEVIGTLTENVKVKYLCTLLRGKTLCEFEFYVQELKITPVTHINQSILGLDT